MARARKSSETSKEKVKPIGLSCLPYSPQVGGNPYVIHVSYKPEGDEYPRVIVSSFLGLYAAKWFVLKLIHTDHWEYDTWKYNEDDTVILTEFGIMIRAAGRQLRDIIEYEFTEQEAEWKDDSEANVILRLKYGKTPQVANDDDEEITETEEGEPVVTKVVKTKEPKKIAKMKVDREGKLTAGDLAEQLKIQPSEFRAALRKLKMTKPTGGWLFNKEEADDIISRVKKVLK